MRMWFLFMMAVVFACGCGRRASDSGLAGDDHLQDRERYALVAFGGYNSCAKQIIDPETEKIYGHLPGQSDEDEPSQDESGVDDAAPADDSSKVTSRGGWIGAFSRIAGARATPTVTRYSPIGTSLFEHLMTLSTKARARGGEVEWVATCYGPGDDADNDDKNIYVVTSAAPDITVRTSRAALWQFFEAALKGSRLFLFGHSHGGWTALKTILVTGFKIAGMITIDPISVPDCQWMTEVACTKFPTDISNRKAIRSLVETWLHFFQIETRVLHSGLVPEADNESDQLIEKANHISIKDAPEIWTSAEAMINDEMGVLPSLR